MGTEYLVTEIIQKAREAQEFFGGIRGMERAELSSSDSKVVDKALDQMNLYRNTFEILEKGIEIIKNCNVEKINLGELEKDATLSEEERKCISGFNKILFGEKDKDKENEQALIDNLLNDTGITME